MDKTNPEEAVKEFKVYDSVGNLLDEQIELKE